MIVEQHFSDRSAYPKAPSKTSTPLDAVEWFARNKGITNLDDLGTKIKTIMDDANNCELARQKAKKERESKAQDDFLDAMFNLDSGKAELRQKRDRTPLSTSKKAAKKVARPAKKAAKTKPVTKQKVVKKSADRNRVSIEITERRNKMISDLKAGVRVPAILLGDSNTNHYYRQRGDLRAIYRDADIKPIRFKSIKDNTAFFLLDDLKRHQMDSVSGRLDRPDRSALLAALASGELVSVDSVKLGAKVGSASMKQLAVKHGMDIHTVFNEQRTIGWIIPGGNDTEMPHSLKMQAAYKEFEIIARRVGATVEQVLAVKIGQ